MSERNWKLRWKWKWAAHNISTITWTYKHIGLQANMELIIAVKNEEHCSRGHERGSVEKRTKKKVKESESKSERHRWDDVHRNAIMDFNKQHVKAWTFQSKSIEEKENASVEGQRVGDANKSNIKPFSLFQSKSFFAVFRFIHVLFRFALIPGASVAYGTHKYKPFAWRQSNFYQQIDILLWCVCACKELSLCIIPQLIFVYEKRTEFYCHLAKFTLYLGRRSVHMCLIKLTAWATPWTLNQSNFECQLCSVEYSVFPAYEFAIGGRLSRK